MIGCFEEYKVYSHSVCEISRIGWSCANDNLFVDLYSCRFTICNSNAQGKILRIRWNYYKFQ